MKFKSTYNQRDAAAVQPRCLAFETLEDRLLLSVSAEEQHFIYLLNGARHDPAAYQRQVGLPVDLSQVVPRPPLAVNAQLMQSAGQRSDEMARYDYVSHQSEVTGIWPNQLARGHGYPLPSAWPNDSNSIESISAGTWYGQADIPLKSLIADQGVPSATHRRHLLGIDAFYAENREIGVGFATAPDSTYGHYWTVHIARREDPGVFLTGVAYVDANGNGRYDPGEGLRDVTIRTIAPPAMDRTTQTNHAGGFSLPVPAHGRYRIYASGSGFAIPATGSVDVADANVHLDVVSGTRGMYLDFADRPTSAWTNPRNRLDVSNNQAVDPLDALHVINYLNTAGPGELDPFHPSDESPASWLDVDGDGRVLPTDALYVINYLNRTDDSGEGEQDVVSVVHVPFPFPMPVTRPLASCSSNPLAMGVIRTERKSFFAANPTPLFWPATRKPIPVVAVSYLATATVPQDGALCGLGVLGSLGDVWLVISDLDLSAAESTKGGERGRDV